jgi:DNA-binding NarL/FixJ family response regulator
MKYVEANTLMYDAALGQVLPGEVYYVEDDKAERWVVAGVATVSRPPMQETPPAPPAPPVPDPQPIPPEPIPPEPEPGPEPDDEQKAEVKRLWEAGQSQRAIAEQLGISRQHVHNLLRT